MNAGAVQLLYGEMNTGMKNVPSSFAAVAAASASPSGSSGGWEWIGHCYCGRAAIAINIFMLRRERED